MIRQPTTQARKASTLSDARLLEEARNAITTRASQAWLKALLSEILARGLNKSPHVRAQIERHVVATRGVSNG